MIEIIEQPRTELDRLCRQHHVGRLELFGSAATGDFDPATSDLDFIVEFLPLPPGGEADAYFGFLYALQDLFGRKVDLLGSQPSKNRWLQRSIDRQRVVHYAA